MIALSSCIVFPAGLLPLFIRSSGQIYLGPWKHTWLLWFGVYCVSAIASLSGGITEIFLKGSEYDVSKVRSFLITPICLLIPFILFPMCVVRHGWNTSEYPKVLIFYVIAVIHLAATYVLFLILRSAWIAFM